MVAALFVVAGFVWLHPASAHLLAGNTSTVIGDGTDSITIPWQYHLILDTLREAPSRLLFGGIYSDQVSAPEGYAVYVPYSERVLVLLLAPFMNRDLLPTGVVWAFVVITGVSMHACGRLLGWPRTIAFALALAFAICPYTRARAVVHNAMVGVYFAPLVVAALRLVAGAPRKLGWSSRRELVVGALLLVCAVSAFQYYAIILIGFAPLFAVLYVLMLPYGASKVHAAKRLFIAILPALLLLGWTKVMPSAPSDTKRFATVERPAAVVKKERENFLKWYGAHASHYVSGDVRFGDRDVLPWRSAITAEVRHDFPANLHESTNGIRWTILAAAAALLVIVAPRRLRRRLAKTDRKLAVFALVFGACAFLVSLSPQGLRYYDTDLGPSLLLARLVPEFRVPNRVGVLVHFAALLCAGIVFTLLASRLRRRVPAGAVGAALLVLVVVEYLPLHPIIESPMPARRAALVPPSGACGAGILLPYASWEADESRYYHSMSEVRGTSCKILHGGYLTVEEPPLRTIFATGKYAPSDRERATTFARCTRASWAAFAPDVPEDYRRAFCADLGWRFVSPDACRTSDVVTEARPLRECL